MRLLPAVWYSSSARSCSRRATSRARQSRRPENSVCCRSALQLQSFEGMMTKGSPSPRSITASSSYQVDVPLSVRLGSSSDRASLTRLSLRATLFWAAATSSLTCRAEIANSCRLTGPESAWAVAAMSHTRPNSVALEIMRAPPPRNRTLRLARSFPFMMRPRRFQNRGCR